MNAPENSSTRVTCKVDSTADMAGGQSEDLVREFRKERQRYENLEQRLKSLIDELIRTEACIHT
jgi:hypothetical protein